MAMKKPPSLRATFLSKDEEEVLIKYARKINPRADIVEARALGRYGYTGAKVLLVYFHHGHRGIPFVVKINAASKIEREHSSIVEVQSYFADALSGFAPEYHQDVGAITYRHWGGNNSASVESSTELRDIVFDLRQNAKFVNAVLGGLYSDCCIAAHKASSLMTIDIKKDYDRYLRKHASRPMIESVLSSRPRVKGGEFHFLGARILDPLYVLEALLGSRIQCLVGPIHGDLHPNNVVIDEIGRPHLIDFAWARRGHVLKDFALMECSLRFLLFPRFCDLELQCRVDKCLLDEDGHEGIGDLVEGMKYLKKYYIRLAELLCCIRRAARDICGEEYKFSEYLLAQFVILYGLLRFDGYSMYSGVRALGMMGRRLIRSGFCP